jgi:hypothetical protein
LVEASCYLDLARERFNLIESWEDFAKKIALYPHTLMQGNYGGHVNQSSA